MLLSNFPLIEILYDTYTRHYDPTMFYSYIYKEYSHGICAMDESSANKSQGSQTTLNETNEPAQIRFKSVIEFKSPF